MSPTKLRIAEASLQLFNEQGERSVTTNHIAAHLGMSPGNLYYHFRNKEAIIHAIFDRYADHWQQTLEMDIGDGIALERVMPFLDAVFDGIWHFRFFYVNLSDLLARDEQLRERYQQLQLKLERQLHVLLLNLVENGVLKLEKDQLNELVHVIKLVISSWISYRISLAPDAKITEHMIHEGINKVLFILSPWFSDEYQGQLHQLLSRKAPPGQQAVNGS